MRLKDEKFYKTVRDFLDIYLIRHKGYSLNTQKSYREAINLLLLYFKMERGLEYANVGFEDITYSNITGFLEWLSKSRGCSPATVNLRLMAIRSFTKYAGILDSGKIYMQVEVGNISIRKTPGKVVEFLTVPALETLFEQPNRFKTNGYRDFCFMRLMYDTAARCQELVDAKIHDLIIRKTHATICLAGKGNKLRILPGLHQGGGSGKQLRGAKGILHRQDHVQPRVDHGGHLRRQGHHRHLSEKTGGLHAHDPPLPPEEDRCRPHQISLPLRPQYSGLPLLHTGAQGAGHRRHL